MNVPARRTWKAACALLLCGSAIACDDGLTGAPEPGTAVLSIDTPALDDAAILVRLTGPGLSNVQPVSSGDVLAWRLVSDTEISAVVVGSITSGPLLTLAVSDLRRLSEYAATTTQVADRSGEPRASLIGYSLSFSGGSSS